MVSPCLFLVMLIRASLLGPLSVVFCFRQARGWFTAPPGCLSFLSAVGIQVEAGAWVVYRPPGLPVLPVCDGHSSRGRRTHLIITGGIAARPRILGGTTPAREVARRSPPKDTRTHGNPARYDEEEELLKSTNSLRPF